jgi:hypothetical protein
MLAGAVWQKCINFSEKPAASNFRAENEDSNFLKDVCAFLSNYMTLRHTRHYFQITFCFGFVKNSTVRQESLCNYRRRLIYSECPCKLTQRHSSYLWYNKRWKWSPRVCRHASTRITVFAKTHGNSVGGFVLQMHSDFWLTLYL